MNWLEEKIFKRFENESEYLFSDLIELKNYPLSFIDTFFNWSSSDENKLLPSQKYIKSLKALEPILYHTGKRGHYIHMFNCLLLGNILLHKLSKMFNWKSTTLDKLQKYWFLISLNHDIAYPLELLEKELTIFLEYYFHGGYAPKIYVGKELYFGYDFFFDNLNQIMDQAKNILKITTKSDELRNIIIFNLMEKVDHGIVSALLTMKFINDEWKSIKKIIIDETKEQVNNIVGTTIALHNLHQWKYYALKELNEVCQNGEITVRELKSKFRLLAYLQSKKKELDDLFNTNKTGEEIVDWNKAKNKNIIENIQNSIRDIRIKPLRRPVNDYFINQNNVVSFLVLLLVIVDSLQEWGRDIYFKEPLKLLSIRKVENKISKKTLSIQVLSPHIKIAEDVNGKPGDPPIDNVIITTKGKEKLQFQQEEGGDPVIKIGGKEVSKLPLYKSGSNKYYYEFIDRIEQEQKDKCQKLNTKKAEHENKRRFTQYNMLKIYFVIRDRLANIFCLKKWIIEIIYLTIIKDRERLKNKIEG